MKRAVITGASSGLGRALALLLDRRGYSLLLTGRDPARLSETAALCSSAETFPLDLTTDLAALLELIKTRKPDLLINGAGFGLYGRGAELPLEEQLEMIRLNCEAVVAATLEMVRLGRGTVLNISSAMDSYVAPNAALYGASKALVTSFSRALDGEGSPVRVLTCSPGQIDTGFYARASRGKLRALSWGVMSVERVASQIVKQIEKRQSYRTLDWRYRLMRALTRLLPTGWMARLLRANLSNRC